MGYARLKWLCEKNVSLKMGANNMGHCCFTLGVHSLHKSQDWKQHEYSGIKSG